MLIRSRFMRRIISQILNKALKKQAPGVEVELKEAQVNWVDTVSYTHLHAQEIANEIQARTGIDSRATILGHVQRGGSPTLRDLSLIHI